VTEQSLDWDFPWCDLVGEGRQKQKVQTRYLTRVGEDLRSGNKSLKDLFRTSLLAKEVILSSEVG